MKYKMNVEEMDCMHCARKIKNTLLNINGVNSAVINIEDEYIIIEGEAAKENILKNVEELGYKVRLMKSV